LLADRYAYDFDGHHVAQSRPAGGIPPTFACRASPSTPLTGAERPKHLWPWGSDPFLLTRDRQPVAWTDSHGTSIEWIA
jgi:hypothetical protein